MKGRSREQIVLDACEYAESIVNAVREPLVVLDRDLKVVSASRSFYECFKVSPQETEGQFIYDLGNRQWDIKKLRELLETILPETATIEDFEVKHDFPGIGRRVMLLKARRIPRPPEKMQVILLAIDDITESRLRIGRKRAEEALGVSEEKYREIINEINDGIFNTDERGVITFANDALASMYGFESAEELFGKRIDCAIAPEARDEIMRSYEEGTRSGKWPEMVEVPLLRGDGSAVLMEVRPVAIEEDGMVVGTRGVARDITDRKRAEERMAAVNRCLLGLGAEYDENVNSITRTAGEVLGANCALYNRLEGPFLCSVGMWNQPPGYDPKDRPEGHICYDVIGADSGDCLVVRDLQHTKYAESDPNVKPYELQTYIGHVVRSGGRPVGSLCVVYAKDHQPAQGELDALGALAGALGIEEARRASQEGLESKLTEIGKLNELMMGREGRVIEMKEEVNSLLEELGREPKYGV